MTPLALLTQNVHYQYICKLSEVMFETWCYILNI